MLRVKKNNRLKAPSNSIKFMILSMYKHETRIIIIIILKKKTRLYVSSMCFNARTKGTELVDKYNAMLCSAVTEVMLTRRRECHTGRMLGWGIVSVLIKA